MNSIVVGQAFYLFGIRRLSGPVSIHGARPAIVAVVLVLGLQLLFTYLPPLQRLFGTTAIGVEAWLGIVTGGSIVLLVVELEKRVLRVPQSLVPGLVRTGAAR